jgi:hypothetical protein
MHGGFVRGGRLIQGGEAQVRPKFAIVVANGGLGLFCGMMKLAEHFGDAPQAAGPPLAELETLQLRRQAASGAAMRDAAGMRRC